MDLTNVLSAILLRSSQSTAPSYHRLGVVFSLFHQTFLEKIFLEKIFKLVER